MFHRLPAFALFALLALLLATPAAAQPPSPEILWDTWGVPHIYAETDEALFYGFGWAQARNHGDLILKLYGEARGRAAEYWGEDFLANDRLMHTLDVPAQGAAGYAALDDDFRRNIDAFARGFTAYAEANRDQIADAREVVLPVTSEDVLAHGVRVMRYVFMARQGLRAAVRWQEGRLEDVVEPEPMDGSNAWALAPSRTADGRAMLVANPHQPWSDLGLWMEAHFVTPDHDLYGAALVGTPVLGIAFNPYLGWTHTNNTRDGYDLYRLIPGANGGYMLDGEERAYETREITIRVRGEDGTLRDETFTARATLHGPIVAEREDGAALAIRVVCERCWEAAEQWWEMAQARTLAEFEDALRPVRIPMFTVMYADREGNIMHLFNAQVPIRDRGDWAFWNGTTPVDDCCPSLIPGDDSAYIWTGYHPYEDLPKVINPPTGWLQNANEAPWTTTYPWVFDPADYPPYIAPPPFTWPRPSQSLRLLYENDDVTFDELTALKQTTEVELARWVLDDLVAAAQASDDDLTRQAGAVLRDWDGTANANSVGGVLFAAWAAGYLRPLGLDALAVPFSMDDPFNTPRGLADPAAAAVGLGDIARQLELLRPLGGGIDVAYGDAFRMRVGEYDLPASGGDDPLGTFRTLTFAQDEDLRFRVTQGESYIAVIAFNADALPEARVLLTYGNATQPGSPHVGDQLALFAAGEMREAWRTREEIEANLAERETLGG
jgi:acyl-homoserine-lactone acylase